MTTITQNQLSDFIASTTGAIHGRITGYVVTLEERKGSHLGKSIRLHPGNDTPACAMLDIAAEVQDAGRTWKAE